MKDFVPSGREFWPRALVRVAFCFVLAILCIKSPSAALAQQSDWQTVVANAKKEGKVTLYTAQVPFVVERVVNGFKKAYPEIQVEVLRQSSGPLLAKINQERDNGIDGGDVFVGTELPWLKERYAEGKILKLDGPATANWPSQYNYAGIYIAGIEPVVIIYNTDQIKTPPSGYAELANPKFKGQVGLSDITATTVIGWYDWIERTQGKDYLPKIKQLGPKFYIATTAAQAVASGEITVSLFANTTGVKPLMTQGAPINFVVPKPGFAFRYAVGPLGWSKRPNAAKVLADYILSPDGQTLWHGGGESASPLSGIPGSLDASTMSPFEPGDYPPAIAKARTEYWNSVVK